MLFRQPVVEGGSANSPGIANLEAGNNAALDEAINRYGMHPQYFGNLGHRQKGPKFRFPDRDPFHTGAPSPLRVPDSLKTSLRGFKFSEPTSPLSSTTFFQILRRCLFETHVE
jgi:hypothetical protein